MQKQLPSNLAFTNAIKEVLGEIDASPGGRESALILNDNSLAHLVALCQWLDEHFPNTCACGLAQQIGRSAFTYLLRDSNGMNSLIDQTFRLMPGKLRMKQGFNYLEQLIEDIFEIPVVVIDVVDTIQLKTSDEHRGHILIPYLEAGFVQEFVHWVDGGKPHTIKVKGERPGWSIMVGRQPLES